MDPTSLDLICLNLTNLDPIGLHHINLGSTSLNSSPDTTSFLQSKKIPTLTSASPKPILPCLKSPARSQKVLTKEPLQPQLLQQSPLGQEVLKECNVESVLRNVSTKQTWNITFNFGTQILMSTRMIETHVVDRFKYLIYLVLCPLQHTIARGVVYVN